MKKHWIARMLLMGLLAVSSTACCALPRTTRSPTTAPNAEPTLVPTLRPAATLVPTQVPIAQPVPTVVPLAGVNELEAQVESVYSAVGPSVVNITSQIIGYNFFMQPVPETGTGSGFVYDGDGHIVTNYHVVENADSVTVALADGGVYTATVVGQDPSTDLAVLHIDAKSLPPPLPLGDSSRLRVGQFVLAIGNPFRLQRTLTLGIISALERVIQSPDGSFIAQAIQTDAAINPGNSGGPLLDLSGQVIGVNSQIIGATGANVGIGFAIASNTVRTVVPELLLRGHYPHPWIGLDSLDITPGGAEALRQAGMDVTVEQGALVTAVVAGGPAAQAGIRGADRVVRIGRARVPIGGDILTSVDGQPITSGQDLTMYMDTKTAVGQTIQITLIRGGTELTVAVTLTEAPQQ